MALHILTRYLAHPRGTRVCALSLLACPVCSDCTNIRCAALPSVPDLVVASRGKDFVPEKHAEVLQNGAEHGYLPTVDVFLPVCNEPIDLIANTWKYVSALDYPYATVHVLDDGAKDNVRDLAEAFGFRCEHGCFGQTPARVERSRRRHL